MYSTYFILQYLHSVEPFEQYSVTLSDSVGFVLTLRCYYRVQFKEVSYVMLLMPMYITVANVMYITVTNVMYITVS